MITGCRAYLARVELWREIENFHVRRKDYRVGMVNVTFFVR